MDENNTLTALKGCGGKNTWLAEFCNIPDNFILFCFGNVNIFTLAVMIGIEVEQRSLVGISLS